MNDHDDKLTLQDAEQLCRLYMDCRLSVSEEGELRYLLTRLPFRSPLIDETKALMGIELTVCDKAVTVPSDKKLRPWPKRLLYSGIAASLALLIGLAIAFNIDPAGPQGSEAPYYLAYADGHRLDEAKAKAQAEAEMQAAEAFMMQMSAREAQEKEMIDNFITANPLEQ